MRSSVLSINASSVGMDIYPQSKDVSELPSNDRLINFMTLDSMTWN